ncbi:hypothetical protein [Helicobacter pylori]
MEANNGSTFLFKGMQEYNAGNIKSIADINITWIERRNILASVHGSY